MADPNKPGEQTTEYKVMKWIGIIAAVLVASLTALVATGAIPPDTTGGAILAAAIPVFGALATMTGSNYIKGRSVIKAANAKSAVEPAEVDP
jgi:butyrate kinase